MADGVWFINDNADAIDPATYAVNGVATIRIRRVELNYAVTGNVIRITLWARAGVGVSENALTAAVRERSTAALPASVPRPSVPPVIVTPSSGSVPVPSGTPPYPYGIPVYDSKNGAWVWVAVDVKPATGESNPSDGLFPSLNTYPSLTVFPSP